jgi:hypothetical protein
LARQAGAHVEGDVGRQRLHIRTAAAAAAARLKGARHNCSSSTSCSGGKGCAMTKDGLQVSALV